MGKAEKGTPKAIANAMKAKGLGKLKWYCQVCEKQCRDDNGFKQHTMSEGHLRAMITVGDSAGKTIQGYSSQFQAEFLQLLSRRWGTKRVKANQVYQEFIQDKSHLHMNATRWVTLTEFVKYLGRSGIVHVDETEKGWFISWIDNSPKALAKQAASQAKERQDVDDEQRERRMLAEQIKRAKEAEARFKPEASGSGIHEAAASTEGPDTESEPPKPIIMAPISFSFAKPAPPKDEPSEAAASPAPPEATAAAALPSVGLKMNPLKKPSGNALKSNALKASSSSKSAEPKVTASGGGAGHSLTAVEQLMAEDLERKRRMAERDDRDRKRPRHD